VASLQPSTDPAPLSQSANALLNAASALMIERDSVNITFADIAQKSGLNSALIRYHFGSKAGLFRALLSRDAGGTYDDLQRLVHAPMSAVAKLRHHIHGVIKVYWRYPYTNRLLGALAVEGDVETARFIAERFTRPLVEAQHAILEQGKAEGSFRDIDPMLFHYSLIGACDHLFHAGHSLRLIFGIESIDDTLRKRHAEHVTGIVLHSVLKRPLTEDS
jgi:TetR/AcrR family transcriptional regulator